MGETSFLFFDWKENTFFESSYIVWKRQKNDDDTLSNKNPAQLKKSLNNSFFTFGSTLANEQGFKNPVALWNYIETHINNKYT